MSGSSANCITAGVEGDARQRKADSRPARPGSLGQELARTLTAERNYYARQDRFMAELFGQRVRRDPLREEVVRLVLIAYAEGRPRRMSDIVRECGRLGSTGSVKPMLHTLRDAGLVILQPDDKDRRAVTVLPSAMLVRFYQQNLPGQLGGQP